jgi:hypothetical protein
VQLIKKNRLKFSKLCNNDNFGHLIKIILAFARAMKDFGRFKIEMNFQKSIKVGKLLKKYSISIHAPVFK